MSVIVNHMFFNVPGEIFVLKMNILLMSIINCTSYLGSAQGGGSEVRESYVYAHEILLIV